MSPNFYEYSTKSEKYITDFQEEKLLRKRHTGVWRAWSAPVMRTMMPFPPSTITQTRKISHTKISFRDWEYNKVPPNQIPALK